MCIRDRFYSDNFHFCWSHKRKDFLKEKNTETKQDMVKLKLQHLLSINKYSPGQKDTAEKFSNYAGGDLSKSHQNPQFCSSTEYWSSDISLAWMFTYSHLSWEYLLTVICRGQMEHFWIETWMHPINSQAKSSVISISAGNQWSKNS